MRDRKASRKKLLFELTRRDILESGVAVLKEDGIAGFTVEKVAARAGVAKGSVYLYFTNKQMLLESITDFTFEPLEEELFTLSEGPQQPLEKMELYAAAVIGYLDRNKDIYRELKSIMFSSLGHHVSDSGSWYWRAVDFYAATLSEAVADGTIRPVNTIKVAALFINSLNALMMHQILIAVPESVEDDVRDLMDLYIYGLAPRS